MIPMVLHTNDDGARARDARPDPHWGGRLHNKGARRGDKRSSHSRVRKDVTEAKKDKERKHERGTGWAGERFSSCLAAAALLMLQRPGQRVREREERAVTSGMRRAQSGSHW
jgi:hypothetical protein